MVTPRNPTRARQAAKKKRSPPATNRKVVRKMTAADDKNPATMPSAPSQIEELVNMGRRVTRSQVKRGIVLETQAESENTSTTVSRAVPPPPSDLPPTPAVPTRDEKTPEKKQDPPSHSPAQEASSQYSSPKPPLSSVTVEELEEFKELVRCTVCLDILRIPIYKCAFFVPLFIFYSSVSVCAHKFCEVCINPWVEKHKNCPQCRKAVDGLARDTFAENIVELFYKINPCRFLQLKFILNCSK